MSASFMVAADNWTCCWPGVVNGQTRQFGTGQWSIHGKWSMVKVKAHWTEVVHGQASTAG
eukprot:195301-Rhodomonas_salina.4